MFGPRLGNVFKSRRQALFWGASVLLTAYCSVPDPAPVAAPVTGLAADGDPSARPANPWARDPPGAPH